MNTQMFSLSIPGLFRPAFFFAFSHAALFENLQGRRVLCNLARQAALGMTILGSTLGIGGVSEKMASAGIVKDFRPDAEYQAYGQEFAGQYRGPGTTPSGGVLNLSLH